MHALVTIFLNIDYRTAVNHGLGEPTGFVGDTSVKMVEVDSLEQLTTTQLNSFSRSQHGTYRPCMEIQDVAKL